MFIILFDVCYQLLKKLGGKKDEYFCFLNLVMFCGVIIKKKKKRKKTFVYCNKHESDLEENIILDSCCEEKRNYQH